MGIEGIDATQFGWQKKAACNLAPSHVFFPEEQSRPDYVVEPKDKGVTYKSFCNDCKVRQICLEFALLHDMQGIWGGMNDNERKNRFSAFERDEMRDDFKDLGSYRALYGHS